MQDTVSLHENRPEAVVSASQRCKPQQLSPKVQCLIASSFLTLVCVPELRGDVVLCGTPPRTMLSSRPAHVFRGRRQQSCTIMPERRNLLGHRVRSRSATHSRMRQRRSVIPVTLPCQLLGDCLIDSHRLASTQ
jgi:hypothetical protein